MRGTMIDSEIKEWKERIAKARDENDYISTKQILSWLHEIDAMSYEEGKAAGLEEATS